MLGRVKRILRGRGAQSAAPQQTSAGGATPETAPQPTPYDIASRRPAVDADKEIRLLIGPANYASQGYAWARAVEGNLPQAAAANVAIVRQQGLQYRADQVVIAGVAAANEQWQAEQFDWVVNNFTHVLIEAQVPIFGQLFEEPGAKLRIGAFREAVKLAEHGVKVAMISHGSDLRDPSRHLETYPDSPFIPGRYPDLEALAQRVFHNSKELAQLNIPYFVSTPDLLEYAPSGAVWCPVVVDAAPWHSTQPVLQRKRPIVVHAPTNPLLKGTELVEPTLRALHEDEKIEYVRIERVAQDELRRIVQNADIVVDQFTLGTYGVTTVEAMAAGRLVLAHVTEANRAIIEAEAKQPIPLLAGRAAEIGQWLQWALDNREEAAELAAAGPGFAQSLHGGQKSAAVLAAHFLQR